MIEGPEVVNYYNLFTKTDPYDVYRYYLGYDFKIRKLYNSPFRKDNNCSFGISVSEKGELIHKDFGDSRYQGNCINFVQQLYNLSFSASIKRIVYDLGLESGNEKIDRKMIYQTEVDREPTLIQIIPKSFTITELNYWNTYGIDKSDLIKEDVYSIRELYVNKKRVSVDKELSFAYLFRADNEYLKIYQPYSTRFKWLSNVPVKRAIGLDKLEKTSNRVTVAKSRKCKIVLKKLITDVYECQKEGEEVITEEIDNYFNSNYTHKYCFFDNDETGKRASKALNSKGYNWINVPNKYSIEGIKDPSDLVRKYGYDKLQQLLVSKDYYCGVRSSETLLI